MPYLTEQRKQELKDGDPLATLGDLTYALTLACLRTPFESWDYALTLEVNDWLDERTEKYQHYAEVLGCLTSTKLEWWRRKSGDGTFDAVRALHFFNGYTEKFYRDRVAPYEDQKISENGDVYG